MKTDERGTVVISGVGPTYALCDGLEKHFQIAIYDQPLAQQWSAEHGGKQVMCPIGGVQQPLIERARNDAVLAASDIINQVQDGFSLNGLQAKRLANPQTWLPGMAAAHLAEVFVNLHTLKAFAKNWKVVGVVVHEDVMPRFRTLAMWGKAAGVPVIHVPHNNTYLQARPDIHDATVADWIIAASPHMRDWYASRGFPKHRIRITGFPPWDHLSDRRLTHARARAILQMDPDRPVIALCTGWAQRTNLIDDHSVMEAAVHATLGAAKREGWQVVWTLHPGDAPGQEQRYAQLCAAHRVDVAVTRDHRSIALAAADVVLATSTSNVLIEAGIWGAPPAMFPLRGYGFETEPPWVVGLSVDDVVQTVGGLISKDWEQERSAFIQRYAWKIDGNAAKRAARQITRIIKDTGK